MNNTDQITYSNRKTAAIVIAIIASLLCFIGLFGTIMTEQLVTKVNGVTGTQVVDTFDLEYIFSRGWSTITYYSFEVSKFALSLMIISFFVGILGFLFAIGKTIYSLYKKEEVNFKFNLSVLLVAAVQYIFMSRYALGYDGTSYTRSPTNVNTVYLMGWGVILITIGFFLGLVSLFLYDFDSKESVINKTSICTRISSIVIYFVGLYGLTNMVSLGIKTTNDYTIKSFNSFSFISYLNADCADSANYAATKALTIIACIFGIIAFIGACASALYFIKGADTEDEKKIVNASTISFVAASLISNIFMIIAGHIIIKDSLIPDVTMSVIPGFSFIVSLILGIALILLVSFTYKKFKTIKTK